MRVIAGGVLLLSTAVLFPAPAVHAQDGCDELVAAAGDDDVARIAQFIGTGVKVNCRDPVTAETALMRAARKLSSKPRMQ